MEWVESTWNDMDSTWIPCGMWGEGKDLVGMATSLSAYPSSLWAFAFSLATALELPAFTRSDHQTMTLSLLIATEYAK
jgi:hypothetical protein